MSDIITRAILKDEMSAQLAKIKNEFEAVDKQAKKTSKGTEKASKSFGDVTGKARLMKAALTGLAVGGVGIFVKSLVGAAAEMETLETKFKVLLGDTESAKARMQELSKFASSTPFQLTEIANASKVLQTLGGTTLATGESLRLVGDAAAISGESFENLAVHVGRAYSGLQANRPIGESLARLQELGLVSGETRNQIEDLTKQAKGADAWKVLRKELMKTKGGMDQLSKTWGGLTSTLKDQFTEALRQVANSGFFEDIKKGLGKVVKGMADILESGFFQRIGAGWDYIKFGFMGMMQVVVAGWQRIEEVAFLAMRGMLGTINTFIAKLPQSIVPDSWGEALVGAELALDDLYKSARDNADDTSYNAAVNLDKMTHAWNLMLGNTKIVIKKYKENMKDVKPPKGVGGDQWWDFDDNGAAQAQLDEDKANADKRAEFNKSVAEANAEAKRKAEDQQTAIHKKGKDDREALDKAEYQARLNLYMALTSSLSTIAQNALGNSKKNAKARKAIALSEAAVNTSLGVTKALSSSGPPLNFINAGIVGAQGAAQISTIASQKFATGGIVKGGSSSDIGDKTMIRVNAGEGVFTKDQMKALGGMNNAPSISIGDINISGDADSSTIQGLDNTLQKFADKILDSIRGGELDLVNELNLVTQ